MEEDDGGGVESRLSKLGPAISLKLTVGAYSSGRPWPSPCSMDDMSDFESMAFRDREGDRLGFDLD